MSNSNKKRVFMVIFFTVMIGSINYEMKATDAIHDAQIKSIQRSIPELSDEQLKALSGLNYSQINTIEFIVEDGRVSVSDLTADKIKSLEPLVSRQIAAAAWELKFLSPEQISALQYMIPEQIKFYVRNGESGDSETNSKKLHNLTPKEIEEEGKPVKKEYLGLKGGTKTVEQFCRDHNFPYLLDD